MIYDSVRIIGLKIYSHINITLIKLCSTPSNMKLKSELIRLVILFCHSSMLLFSKDKHMIANINHFAYSRIKFNEIIEQAGLMADFNYAQVYLNQVSMN